MARIRTIKPEFFTSEDIVALSAYARLLYIALWCEADKEGRLSWKPLTFKLRYFPGDPLDINACCNELLTTRLVVRYGDGLAYIPRFSKHQHVNPRESASELPAPPGVRDEGPRKVGKNLREEVFERDGHKCVRCGSTDRIQVDHILPQSCGGPHILENLRTLCRSCNAGRPVAGQALDDDLAKDGFTVKYLREKFGIDASTLDLHAQGGREGKGKEGKEEDASTRPTHAITFKSWIESIPEGEHAIPPNDPVYAYAERVGLPEAYLRLEWAWFKAKYLLETKRQKDWRQKFRNAVEGGWGNLWRLAPDGTYFLTTQGQQLDRSLAGGSQ